METIKKKCQIIMLSVNEKAIGSEFTIGKRIKTIEKTPDKLVYGCALSDITFQRQHLYIISNDEIKEEDFFMSAFMSYSLHNVKEGYAEYPDTTNCKKIIATTDKTLGLPQIPKEFIEAYILSYNMGSMNTITEIMVEYEEIISYSSKKVDHYKLKIDENNCISITANENLLLKKGYIEIDLEKLANLFSSKTTNEYPKVMRVSDNDGVSCERVVIAKNPFNNRYIAIQDALTIEEAIEKSKTIDICLEWPHAEDIVESKIIELSLEEISDKFNIPIESIRIKK